MTAEELGCRVDYNVCAVLDRTEEVWSCKCVVDEDGETVFVCNGGDGVHVRNVGVGVAKRLEEYEGGIVLYSVLYFLKVVRVHKCGLDAEERERLQWVAS